MLTAAELLHLEAVGPGLYRSRHNLDNGNGAVFGGQLVGLALTAAMAEVPSWPAHNLCAYFLRAGRVDEPLELSVLQGNDGRKFASRRVVVSQGGEVVLELMCSFHEPEAGVQFAPPVPRVARRPEELPTLGDFARANLSRLPKRLIPHYTRTHAIEMRFVDPEEALFGSAQVSDYWLRIPSASGLLPPQQQCLLALMSDYWLPAAAVGLPSPDPLRPNYKIVTLNHSFWLHAQPKVDEWLLYRTEICWAANGRAVARARTYDAADQLLATTTQEFLMRLQPPVPA